jgi:hypothetical protein
MAKYFDTGTEDKMNLWTGPVDGSPGRKGDGKEGMLPALTGLGMPSGLGENNQGDMTSAVLAILTALAQSGQLQQMLGQQGLQGGGGPGGLASLLGGANPGYIMNPLAQMPMGAPMSNGPFVQNMGGMPAGYNDDVARKLAIAGNVGNVAMPLLTGYNGGGLLGGLLGPILSGIGGGLKRTLGCGWGGGGK